MTKIFPLRLKPTFVHGRIGTEASYDVEISLLIHYQNQYRARIECMRVAGFLNIEKLSVHLTLIAGPEAMQGKDELLEGWPKSFDVTVLIMPCTNPVPKINGYYLWKMRSGLRARWHLRVDDDSITDLGTLIELSEQEFDDRPIHLSTSLEYEPWDSPLFATYFRERNLPVCQLPFEYESSLTSQAAMEKIYSNELALDFLTVTGNTIEAPGDRALAMAAVLAEVPVVNNRHTTHKFLPEELSVFPGGGLTHIHYVPWYDDFFRVAIQAWLSSPRRKVSGRDIEFLPQCAVRIGRCLAKPVDRLQFSAAGEIDPGNEFGLSSWTFEAEKLVIDDGLFVFDKAYESPHQIWMLGTKRGEDFQYYLNLSNA